MGILRHVEPAAHEQMANAQAKLREILVTRLQQDPCIHEEVWDGPLTREQFADFVLTNLMIHLQREDDCIQPFLDILNRILY